MNRVCYLSLLVFSSEASHRSHNEQKAPIDLESQKMSGSTCSLSRSDAIGSVSGDNLSQHVLCLSQPHPPHKLTGSTLIFSHKRHGPVAMTSAPEATTSNIAVQMRHSSTTMLASFQRTSRVTWVPTCGCPPCVWTSLGLCHGTAQRMSPHPCRRGTRTCPWSTAHPSKCTKFTYKRLGRSCSALHPEPNNKAMLHSLTRKGSNGRGALAHNNAVLERDRVSALPADIDCDRFPETLRSPQRCAGSPGRDLLRWASRPLALMLFDDGAQSNSDSFSLTVGGCLRSLYFRVLPFTSGSVTSILHKPMVQPTSLAQLQSRDHQRPCVLHSTLRPHKTLQHKDETY